MSNTPSLHKVNIRPSVSVLSVLKHLNYKPWFALAEFVDNAIQSALSNERQLRAALGKNYKLKVEIEITPEDGGQIVVRDNAGGIALADFPRAFRPADIPPDRSGLSEFGMGMKSAAFWFASRWSVRTLSKYLSASPLQSITMTTMPKIAELRRSASIFGRAAIRNFMARA